jgi:hypothetical protein
MPTAAGPTPARPPAAANKASRTARARALVAGPPLPDVLLAPHVVAPVNLRVPQRNARARRAQWCVVRNRTDHPTRAAAQVVRVAGLKWRSFSN